jgi:hypothetical protein
VEFGLFEEVVQWHDYAMQNRWVVTMYYAGGLVYGLRLWGRAAR